MSDEINEQYFHGILSRFTIQDILRVHGVHSTLPAPIATIGFPEGLEVYKSHFNALYIMIFYALVKVAATGLFIHHRQSNPI